MARFSFKALSLKVIHHARNLIANVQMAFRSSEKMAILPHRIFVKAANSQINELAVFSAKEHVTATLIAKAAVFSWSSLICAKG